jgi:hypothetical protein
MIKNLMLLGATVLTSSAYAV